MSGTNWELKVDSSVVFVLAVVLGSWLGMNAVATAQNQLPPESLTGSSKQKRDFFDSQWNRVDDQNQATYYLRAENLGPQMLVKGVPTYDNGMQLKADSTPMDRYRFDFHYVGNDQLALSVLGVALRANPKDSLWNGAAVWYDRDGTLTAKGNYKLGKLHGDYIQFDGDGEITSSTKYNMGEIYSDTQFKNEVYKPLLGRWVQEEINKSKRTKKILLNEYRTDGTMYVESKKLGAMDFQLSRGSATFAWRFLPSGNVKGGEKKTVKGVIEYYHEGELVQKSKVTVEKNRLRGVCIYHRESPNSAGNKYDFKRQK